MKAVIVTYHSEIDKGFLGMAEKMGICDYGFSTYGFGSLLRWQTAGRKVCYRNRFDIGCFPRRCRSRGTLREDS